LISTKEDEGDLSSGTTTAVSSASEDECKKVKTKKTKRMKLSDDAVKETEKPKERKSKAKKSVPLYLGGELPALPITTPAPILILATQTPPQRLMTPPRRSRVPVSPTTPMTPKSVRSSPMSSPCTPGSPALGRTLRRVGVRVFPPRLQLLVEGEPMLGRRISFGDMQNAADNGSVHRMSIDGAMGMMLDSPFDDSGFHLRGRI
jgi:hypothetical protein